MNDDLEHVNDRFNMALGHDKAKARDRAVEEATAERYRADAEMFAEAAREARGRGDEDTAVSHDRSAYDHRVLAAGIERAHRGLPPLPAAWGPEGIG